MTGNEELKARLGRGAAWLDQTHPGWDVPDAADWMHVTVVAPANVGRAVLEFLKGHGFVDIAPVDWCAMERREDLAHVDYAPAEPITTNPYVVDWRTPEEGVS